MIVLLLFVKAILRRIKVLKVYFNNQFYDFFNVYSLILCNVEAVSKNQIN